MHVKALPRVPATVHALAEQMHGLTMSPSSTPGIYFRKLKNLIEIHDSLVPRHSSFSDCKMATLIMSKLPKADSWKTLIIKLATPPAPR